MINNYGLTSGRVYTYFTNLPVYVMVVNDNSMNIY